MIKIECADVYGFEPAIRGMRSPYESWSKSDSEFVEHDHADVYYLGVHIGPNDHDLMMKLASGGPVHAKYRRMITVYCDITAPLYWWKEFDTYKVGTVANSCSTMHKIHGKEFTLDDFSHEHLNKTRGIRQLEDIIIDLNFWRDIYVCGGCVDNYDGTETIYHPKDKDAWWQMIQLLPSSYNQRRTVMLNYEVLAGIYPMRKDHKLDEWREFCRWIEGLPYSEIITGMEEKANG